eukprot:335784_1
MIMTHAATSNSTNMNSSKQRKGVTSMAKKPQVPRVCKSGPCHHKTTTSTKTTPKKISSAFNGRDASSGGCESGVMQCFNKDCTVKGHYHKVIRPPLTEAARRLKEKQDAEKDKRKKKKHRKGLWRRCHICLEYGTCDGTGEHGHCHCAPHTHWDAQLMADIALKEAGTTLPTLLRETTLSYLPLDSLPSAADTDSKWSEGEDSFNSIDYNDLAVSDCSDDYYHDPIHAIVLDEPSDSESSEEEKKSKDHKPCGKTLRRQRRLAHMTAEKDSNRRFAFTFGVEAKKLDPQ